MCQWRIGSFGVEERFERFVGRELDGGEWDGHGKGRGVGYVERGETFGSVYRSGAGPYGPMRGIAKLHALLNDCESAGHPMETA